MKFALITEGASEHNIIKHVIEKYFKNYETFFRPIFPTIINGKQISGGGWSEVLKYCERIEDLKEIFIDSDYLVIQIDTDQSQTKPFSISHTKKDNTLKSVDELCNDVIVKLCDNFKNQRQKQFSIDKKNVSLATINKQNRMNNTILLEKTTLAAIPIDYSWSFADKTIKDTSYITHGYYTYPAKFIPQLASRLIKEHSKENDIVIDPFLGSGTTVVEAIVNNRIGIGTDINDIAYLIAKVKTTPIKSMELLQELTDIDFELKNRLNGQYDFFLKKSLEVVPQNERIDYWFLPQQKEKLSIIFSRILEVKNNDIRNFFLVSFAQILKSCSIWLQKSVKPTRDQNKKIYEPLTLFLNQSRKMIKKHSEFDKILNPKIKQNIDRYRVVQCCDSRNLPCEKNKATLIVTSPPYVTSYEYADLHQLPSLWFGYLSELAGFRKKFIGSAYTDRAKIDLKSSLAEEIVSQLGENKKGREVKNYFADLLETFFEMKRVLKKGGRACIVIGNTEFNGVKILNAEVFQEQFENIGFKTHDVIHREIPSKMLPSTRDNETGQFVKANDKNLKLAYPTEYILIMEKL